MNQIVIKGRLTESPVLKSTQSGKSVTTITVAVDRGTKDKAADFFNCVFWEQAAQFVCNYFTKGQEILVSGQMQSRKYEDKDGNKRIAWEVQFAHAEFCGGKSSRESAADEPTPIDTSETSETGEDYPF